MPPGWGPPPGGPPGRPGICGCCEFLCNGICRLASNCLYLLCCCCILESCCGPSFGGPHGQHDGPHGPHGGPHGPHGPHGGPPRF